jgi:hypothetical protein
MAKKVEKKVEKVEKVKKIDVNEVELMKQLKVNKLYKNSNGDYFTSENLAILSESGNRKKIETIVAPEVVASGDENKEKDSEVKETADKDSEVKETADNKATETNE